MSSFAKKRLLRDLDEVQRNPSELVSAAPLEADIFEWHANLRPSSGPVKGVIFHVIIKFPANYPDSPPNLIFPKAEIPSFVHPNLYSFGLCLDILSSFIGISDKRAGWSPAYSVQTLLLQLQSFLFEFESAPQDHGGSYSVKYDAARIARVRNESARLSCHCGHCDRRPWPSLLDPAPSRASDLSLQVVSTGPPEVQHVTFDPSLQIVSTGPSQIPHVDEEWIRAYVESIRSTVPNSDVCCASTVGLGISPHGWKLWAERFQFVQRAADPHLLEARRHREYRRSERERQRKRQRERQRQLKELRELQQWADTEGPLHDGATRGLWASLKPPVLLDAFMYLESPDVVAVTHTCKIWRRLSIRCNLAERVQLCCFYTKFTADQDILGFGVTAEYQKDGNLKSLSTELDTISATAFNEHNLRRGAWGEGFTHFLPQILDQCHSRRSMPEVERSLAILASGSTSATAPTFEPWMALATIPQLMNSFVVSLMQVVEDHGDVPRHASERALLGFCSFHHLSLALLDRYPIIGRVATDKLHRFIKGECNKADVPNLGNLLVYVLLTDNVKWETLASAVVDEAYVRNALWCLKDDQRLAWDISPKERNSLTFSLRLTSLRILMFQAYFMRNVARPYKESLANTLARYNRQFGQPTQLQKEALVEETRAILAVSSWDSFYFRMGLPKPGCHELAQKLADAMLLSAKCGYHNPSIGPFGSLGLRCRELYQDSRQAENVGTQRSLKEAFCRAAREIKRGA